MGSKFGADHSLISTARGSLIVDRKASLVESRNRSVQGRGGIVVTAFIILNANGKRDAGERKVGGLKFKISSGKAVRSDRDTNIRVYNLEPYRT